MNPLPPSPAAAPPPDPAWAACRLAEARYAALLEAQPDALIMVDPGGAITEWNPAAERIFGYTRALALGRQATGFISPGNGATPGPVEFAQNLRAGKGRLLGKRTEMKAVRANGGDFPIELALSRTVAGGPPAYIACIRDITDRHRVELTLRRNEQRFRLLVEAVADYAIHLLDTHGRILTWNAGVERIEGYRARDIIGRRFSRLYTTEDIARGKPDRALAIAGTEGRYCEEGWSVRQDGSRFWACIVLTALRDERGVLLGFSRIGRDRTSHRDAELEAGRQHTELSLRLRDCTAALHAAQQAPGPAQPS